MNARWHTEPVVSFREALAGGKCDRSEAESEPIKSQERPAIGDPPLDAKSKMLLAKLRRAISVAAEPLDTHDLRSAIRKPKVRAEDGDLRLAIHPPATDRTSEAHAEIYDALHE